jgi:VanZ family protein
VQRFAKLIFWCAAAFAFVMAVLPHPPEVPGAPSDKIQHIVAFLVLAGLGAWAYPSAGKVRLGLALSVFGALIEVTQAIPALHRDSDIVDWAADTVAAGVVLLALAWRERRA